MSRVRLDGWYRGDRAAGGRGFAPLRPPCVWRLDPRRPSRRRVTRSADDGEKERPIEGVVLLVEDLDVHRARPGAARVEVVVLEERVGVLCCRREVDAVRDVGVELDAVGADVATGGRGRTAALQQRAVRIDCSEEVARRRTRRSAWALWSGRSGCSG